MRRVPLRIAAAALACWLIGGMPAGAQVTAPVPAAESPSPQYPEAALFAGIEGDVRYRAHVAADGHVTAVDVLAVPARGYGFEDVVRRTVSGWRFTPASRDGVAMDGTYEGTAAFIPLLPGEFSFAVASDVAWTAIQDMVKDLRLSAETIDRSQHLLVTRQAKYDRARYPTAEDLDLPSSARIETIEWHLFAPPGFTNSRVAVASVITIQRADRLRFTMYNHAALSQWFAARLAERLGQTAQPLPLGPSRRAAQSPIDPGAWGSQAAQCPTTPQPPVRLTQPGTSAPRPLKMVQANYPGDAYKARREGTVLISGLVTEHGTLSNINFLQADDFEPLRLAAVTAASLWRFVPGRLNGCPVMTEIRIQMSFRLR